jgi:hypothetical protein
VELVAGRLPAEADAVAEQIRQHKRDRRPQ